MSTAANGHSSAEISSIFQDVLKRARSLPGVKAASLSASIPGTWGGISMDVQVPGYTRKFRGDDVVNFNFVSPHYFETLGQTLLRWTGFR
jgi:hypothetical protein